MSRAAIYDRVSLDRRNGRSVAEQSVENRAVCVENDWRVVVEHKDNDRSASRHARKPRENWPLVLADIDAGRLDVLVLWESSRGDRELESWARLLNTCRRLGVLIHITSHERTYDVRKARDWKTLAEEGVANAYASEETSLRVKRNMAASAAKGRPHGKLLYGYRREYDPRSGELVAQAVNEEQAAIIREAARRVQRGETPYAVAKDFNGRGISAPRGGQWDLTQVKRLVTNPAYIAKRKHRGKVVGDADWPPILDEAVFYALTTKLNDPARRTQRDSAVKHLLSGIAAGACGGRIRVQKNRGFLAYLCVEDFCVSRREDWVDRYVTAVVIERLSRPDVLAELAADDSDDETDAARAEAAEKRARLDEFYDAAARGELTPVALSRIERQLLPEIEAAERRAQAVPMSPLLAELARPDLGAMWDELPLTTRREVISLLMSVRILPARRGARSLDPATVEIEWRKL